MSRRNPVWSEEELVLALNEYFSHDVSWFNSGKESMKELDPHVQSILKWQESMVLMNEVSFFELMRSYLGQILTPYNKKKLIEERLI